MAVFTINDSGQSNNSTTTVLLGLADFTADEHAYITVANNTGSAAVWDLGSNADLDFYRVGEGEALSDSAGDLEADGSGTLKLDVGLNLFRVHNTGSAGHNVQVIANGLETAHRTGATDGTNIVISIEED